jgi:hypothetical protein
MTVQELQMKMRHAEAEMASVIQSLEQNGVRYLNLDVERIEVTSKDSPNYPRPEYKYKVNIKTEIESW